MLRIHQYEYVPIFYSRGAYLKHRASIHIGSPSHDEVWAFCFGYNAITDIIGGHFLFYCLLTADRVPMCIPITQIFTDAVRNFFLAAALNRKPAAGQN